MSTVAEAGTGLWPAIIGLSVGGGGRPGVGGGGGGHHSVAPTAGVHGAPPSLVRTTDRTPPHLHNVITFQHSARHIINSKTRRDLTQWKAWRKM